MTCDRCLEEFMMPVGYTGTLAVRYSETEQESDGEVMWIGPSETEIDLSQYIYESICLSLPTSGCTLSAAMVKAVAIRTCWRGSTS